MQPIANAVILHFWRQEGRNPDHGVDDHHPRR